MMGFEPTTLGSTVRCSTAELHPPRPRPCHSERRVSGVKNLPRDTTPAPGHRRTTEYTRREGGSQDRGASDATQRLPANRGGGRMMSEVIPTMSRYWSLLFLAALGVGCQRYQNVTGSELFRNGTQPYVGKAVQLVVIYESSTPLRTPSGKAWQLGVHTWGSDYKDLCSRIRARLPAATIDLLTYADLRAEGYTNDELHVLAPAVPDCWREMARDQQLLSDVRKLDAWPRWPDTPEGRLAQQKDDEGALSFVEQAHREAKRRAELERRVPKEAMGRHRVRESPEVHLYLLGREGQVPDRLAPGEVVVVRGTLATKGVLRVDSIERRR
jgi:hypothetical protein